MAEKKITPNKTASANKAPVPAKAAKPAPDVEARALVKKPDLIEKVVQRTDMKKRDVKLAIEATLAAISESLVDGNDLNLPPLGKVRIVKFKEIADGAQVFTAKIRTMKKKPPVA